MNIIIFSKDRAAQLDLFLRSMKKYFKKFWDYQINILHTYSSDSYKEGYERLFGLHPDSNINFVKENDFKKDLLSLIDEKDEVSIFFVDDIVWKNPFSISSDAYQYFLENKEVLTLSLRLHMNLTYCYPARLNMKPPSNKYQDGYFSFLWRGQMGDYGYPMSLDGHFFKTKDILPLFTGLVYNNPNSLESILSIYPIPNKPKMLCLPESVIMNIPANRVQTFNQNIHGKIPAEFLNTKFLEGYFIDIKPFEGFKNISCHQEMTMSLMKYQP